MNLQNQLVVISHLANTSIAYRVVDFLDRREECVDRNGANRSLFITVPLSGTITFAHGHDHVHFDLCFFTTSRNEVIRIQNFDIRISNDISGLDNTSTFFNNADITWFMTMQLNQDTLQVKDYVRHILCHTRNSGEFMQNTLNTN